MTANIAEELRRQYLSKLGRQSQLYSLMDFFSSERAKHALHNSSVHMKDICLNYDSPNRTSSLKAGIKAHALAHAGRVRPVAPLIQSAARAFSEYRPQQSSDSEEEEGMGASR